MAKYYKFVSTSPKSATTLYGISIADDPGSDGLQPPAHLILCADMYERHADWLLTVLEGIPFPFGYGGEKYDQLNLHH